MQNMIDNEDTFTSAKALSGRTRCRSVLLARVSSRGGGGPEWCTWSDKDWEGKAGKEACRSVYPVNIIKAQLQMRYSRL